jgi:hypothetical protein
MKVTSTLSIEIDKPPAEVFVYTTDPRNLPVWSPNVVEGYWTTEPPTRVGSRGVEVAMGRGQRWESIFEVAEYAPGRVFGLLFLKHPLQPAVDVRTWMWFEPSRRGTKLTVRTFYEATGTQGFFLPLTSRILKSQARRHIALLKLAIEEGPR